LLATGAAAIRQELAKVELGSSGYFRERMTELRSIERNLELLDPVNVMKRGYSITLAGDRLLKTVGDVGPGTMLKTILMDGQIVSTTVSVKKTRKNG
jgi:exodeoxyribonuclease VII large subunit